MLIPKKPRHVLVIGGAGYIGAVLTDVLLEHGHHVRIFDNFIYDHFVIGQTIVGRPRTSVVVGDFRDHDLLGKALEDITDVVLLASVVGDPISRKYPDLTWAINERGSEDLLDFLDGRGLDRFIFTSTCSNYGLRIADEPATENSELRPLSPYAETKVTLERFILQRAGCLDFKPVILRLATAFGFSPRMRFDLTVNQFAYLAARGEVLSVYDKETWRPYCHVRDISAAILIMLEAPAHLIAGEIFNVGSEESNFTKENIVEEILHHVRTNVEFVEGGADTRNYFVSFRKIRESLGFRCEQSVHKFIPELISAVQGGLFSCVEHSEQYGNYRVRNGVA